VKQLHLGQQSAGSLQHIVAGVFSADCQVS